VGKFIVRRRQLFELVEDQIALLDVEGPIADRWRDRRASTNPERFANLLDFGGVATASHKPPCTDTA